MADDPPGFAYVFFESFKEAIKAVETLNGARMCGRRIDVELSPSEDKRKNRGGWAGRGAEGVGGGYRGGDRGGDRGGFRDNYRPRGRGGFRSYDRDSKDDRGGRDYDNRGQRFDNRDSYGGGGGGGWRGGRGGYNNFRGGGGYRGRGGGFQQRWGGRGGYNRDDGGYRGRGGFNRDRNSGDSYSDRGGGGRYYQGGGRGRGSYYERDSYDRRSNRKDDNFSDDEGSSRSKDYDYRESRSSGYGGDHKSQEHSRSKRYSSSPEYVKDEIRSTTKYRKRSEGDEYHHSQPAHPESSSKWDSSPYRQQGGSPDGNYNRSRSRSRSPYTAPEYFSPPRDTYRSSRKQVEKRSGSFEHLDQYPAVEETYSSNRSFERRADYSPEPADSQYEDYRERDRMVKYGDMAEGSRSGSRHYKSSKRSGSEEPIEHKVHEVAGSGSRYVGLEEKGGRSRERGAHPRAYPASERDHRRGTPPSRHPSSPPSHPKRSRSMSRSPSPPPAMIHSPLHK